MVKKNKNIIHINKIAAIYIRVSTMEQKKDGFSPEYQIEACRKHMQEQQIDEYQIYADLAVSGTTPPDKRPGFSKLIEDAEKGSFNIIIFHAFDRLARRMPVAYEMIRLLEFHRIKIIECQHNIDTSTSDGQNRMGMFFLFAQMEHGAIRDRSIAGTKAKARKLGWIGGRIPFGYKKPDDNKDSIPVTDTDEAETVRLIYDWYWNLKGRLVDIKNSLNEQKKSPGKYNNKGWNPTAIKRILQDHKSKYEGGLINGNDNNIYWPKILDQVYPEYPRPKDSLNLLKKIQNN